MNPSARRSFARKVTVLFTASIAVPAVAGEKRFTLPDAVPGDVFLCVAARHNPEREFLDTYWSEIWDGVKQSGVGDDLKDLIGSYLNEEQTAEFQRLRTRALELFNGVDWKGLAGGEIVFAERMNMPAKNPGGGVYLGPPDMIMLFRTSDAEKHYDALVALLDAAVDEIKKAAGEAATFRVDKTSRDGVRMAKVNFLKDVPQAPPISLAIGSRGDVVGIGFGESLLAEAFTMLGESGSTKSIADDPRYQSVFANLPQAEDSKVFFDMQALLKPIHSLADVIAASGKGPNDVYLNSREDPKANELSGRALAAYEKGDFKEALSLIQQAHEAAPSDSVVMYNLACFHALAGDKDASLDWLDKAVDAGFYAPHKIAEDGDFKSVRDDPRFAKAVAKAKEKVAEHAAKEGATGEDSLHDEVMPALIHFALTRILEAVGILDYVGEVEFTEGHSIRKESLAVLVPDAGQRPIYPVFGRAQPGADFDHYLPQETISFSVDRSFNLAALYRFIMDSIRGAGPAGEKALAQWEAIQKQYEIDVEKDVVGWIQGDSVTASLADDGGTVLLLKVYDEEAARKNVTRAMDALAKLVTDAASENPMAAMLNIRRSPALDERLQGFEYVFIGMSPQPLVWGVADQHLIFGSRESAVAACLETAAGKHPSVRTNARVMSEAIAPDGPFTSVSLSDKRDMGKEIAQVLGIVSMVSGMVTMAVPDPQVQRIVSKVSGMIAKLAPVAGRIDFYKSSAALTSFDGRAWRTREVTHFFSPGERPSRSQRQASVETPGAPKAAPHARTVSSE